MPHYDKSHTSDPVGDNFTNVERFIEYYISDFDSCFIITDVLNDLKELIADFHLDASSSYLYLLKELEHECKLGKENKTRIKSKAVSIGEEIKFCKEKYLMSLYEEQQKELNCIESEFQAKKENNLFRIDLKQISLQEYASLLHRIPESVNYLDISDSKLGEYPIDSIVDLFSQIPRWIETLCLQSNSFENYNKHQLIRFINSIPPHIKTVYCYYNNFFKNFFNTWEIKEVLEVIFQLSARLDFKLEEVDDHLLKIESSLKNATNSTLELKIPYYLAKFYTKERFKQISLSVISLDLSFNEFGNNIFDFFDLITNIPEHVTTLDLSGNFPGICDATSLIKFLNLIPVHIKELNLSNNNFRHYKSEELVKIIESIPKHLDFVNLDRNNLFTYNLISDRDLILRALNNLSQQNKNVQITFENNGELPFSRAILPFIEAQYDSQINLPLEILTRIFSFLLPANVNEDILDLSFKVETKIIQQREHLVNQQKEHAASIERMRNAEEEKIRVQNEKEKIKLAQLEKEKKQQAQKQLLEKEKLVAFYKLIIKICSNTSFWSNEVRNSTEKNNFKPAGINSIQQLLEEIDLDDIRSTMGIFDQCREIANHKFSKNFQWAHSLFRGRTHKTNQLYGILKDLKSDNQQSILDATTKLESVFCDESDSRLKQAVG